MNHTGKRDKFLNILKKYGVKEYWCTPEFNPGEEHPYGMLVFPFKNASMFCEIDDLYNDYTEDDTSMLYIFDTNLKNSFDEMSEGKEKGLVG